MTEFCNIYTFFITKIFWWQPQPLLLFTDFPCKPSYQIKLHVDYHMAYRQMYLSLLFLMWSNGVKNIFIANAFSVFLLSAVPSCFLTCLLHTFLTLSKPMSLVSREPLSEPLSHLCSEWWFSIAHRKQGCDVCQRIK